MKKKVFLISLVLATLTLTSCVEHEEVDFEGRVVGGRNCTSIVFEQNMGYVVQLNYPEGVGGTITNDNGQQMKNLVVLYEPDCEIKVGDHIHGKLYWDDKYSRANCTVLWKEKLPEGVFLEVVVD